MEAQEIKRIIIEVRKALGWSTRYLADILYSELYDDHVIDDNETLYQEGLNKFYEKLKKQLGNGKTSSARLIQYLEIMKRHPTFIATDKVLPEFFKRNSTGLDNFFYEEMEKISVELSQNCMNKS